jgi:hypothetical protein
MEMKQIKDFPNYYVTKFGKIWNKKRKIWMSQWDRGGKTNGKKYKKIQLSHKGKTKKEFIHRIVAKAFIKENIDDKEINHIDFNKENNFYKNLEVVTQEENRMHYYNKK